MDAKLLGWARAVKARQGRAGRGGLPVLWLFTDAARLPDPCAAAALLPRGLAGVVLREDQSPRRAAMGAALRRICRARRLALVVAGDARLASALGAGLHLRRGRLPRVRLVRRRLLTSSAHNPVELRRARCAGAQVVFLSPVFPTASHPGAPAMGVLRWRRLARSAGLPVLALGGIDAASLRHLPRDCAGVGAIGAFGQGRNRADILL